jgi:hypothetical protein
MVLLQLSLMDHLGTGPLWGTSQNLTQFCEENWWSALIFVQNYVSGNRMVRTSDMTRVLQPKIVRYLNNMKQEKHVRKQEEKYRVFLIFVF